MAFVHEPEVQLALDDYAAVAHLAAAAESLRAAGQSIAGSLQDRTIWMLSSTATGGGVAELLPTQIALLRDLGLDVRWLILETDQAAFFPFTKQLHNLIHGVEEPLPTAEDRALYDQVSSVNADSIRELLSPDDVLIVHDPQPAGTGALLQKAIGLRTIWRCHIGLDEESPHATAAWNFLEAYLESYERCVFSIEEYVPDFLRARSSIVHPTIDPLSHKNRDLSLHKLVGVLSDSGLVVPHWPLLEPPFKQPARRLQPNGKYAPATEPDDLGLLARPIVTQVSRWDRLKGFPQLLDAFVALKQGQAQREARSHRHRRRIEEARLILAGPDPEAIQDDPEALAVLDELEQHYCRLDAALQADIALITLPLDSRKLNALMVNALQRASDIVVQNSLREGFGLTVAEAMWKRTPVLGSARGRGVALQVRDGVDGRLVEDPEDAENLAAVLHDMLSDSDRLEQWGHNAQLRVHEEFLVFTELQQWLEILTAK